MNEGRGRFDWELCFPSYPVFYKYQNCIMFFSLYRLWTDSDILSRRNRQILAGSPADEHNSGDRNSDESKVGCLTNKRTAQL